MLAQIIVFINKFYKKDYYTDIKKYDCLMEIPLDYDAMLLSTHILRFQ